MRKFSSLASRAVIEFETYCQRVQSTKRPRISSPLKVTPVENIPQNRIGASSATLRLKDPKSGFVSTQRPRLSVPKQNSDSKPVDHQYIAKILSRKDWFLLLNHEFKSPILRSNAQVVVSILQNQENGLATLRFYSWLSSVSDSLCKDLSVRRALSNALFRKGPVLLSGELIRDVKSSGVSLNEDLICALIGSWGRLGLAKYCSEVFDQISYLGIRPSTRLYNAVIDGLVKSNSLDLAYLKFQQMEVDNCVRDKFTYNILIHGVCKANVMDEAPRLIKQMESLGYSPNVFTYTILIDGYCQAKRVDEAFRLLEAMKAKNVKPNDATFRSLINGVFRSLPSNEAFESLFRWFIKEHNLPGVVYDSIIYNICSSSLSDHLVLFLRTAFFNLGGYVPSSSISNTVVTCLLKGSDLEETCLIFECIIDRGAKVDLSTHLALIESLYRSKRFRKGDVYLSWILKEGLNESVYSYNMLIDCFCKAKLMDRALKTLDMMMSRSRAMPNLVTFNTLIAGYCKCRDAAKAREMLVMLLGHGLKPDVFTFSSIIDVLCQTNRVADAFNCYKEMMAWEISPNAVTYNSLIRALCVSGNVPKAMKLLRKMQVDGIPPDAYTFNAIIQKHCKGNEIGEAQRLLRRMIVMGICPDNFTYIAFINALCGCGKLDEAKELLYCMEEKGCRPDSQTCSAVIDALVKGERIQEAEEIWLRYRGRGMDMQPVASLH